MEKEKKHFLKHPVYPGGPKAIAKFLSENLRYPKEALQAKLEGTVLVAYDIDHKGNVVETKVLQGVGKGCDEEACRVIKLLKFDVEKNRGVRVVFHKKQRIEFKLPKAAPKTQKTVVEAQPIQYQYQVTQTAPKNEPENEAKKSSYSYTITL